MFDVPLFEQIDTNIHRIFESKYFSGLEVDHKVNFDEISKYLEFKFVIENLDIIDNNDTFEIFKFRPCTV